MARKTRMIILSITMILIAVLLTGTYLYFLSRIPNQIHLTADSKQEINFSVPVSGQIMPEVVEAAAITNESGSTMDSLYVDFSKPFTVTTGYPDTYMAKLKLFGILPYKTVEINVTDEKLLTPCGVTIGIYMETDGILVIDTGHFTDYMGKDVAPAESELQAGDYILSVNGDTLETKQEFMGYVAACNGSPMNLRIRRNDEIIEKEILPIQDSDGNFKVGIWVRDSTQGIGTMTFIDKDNHFGALGHGVTDVDTGTLMNMDEGDIYLTQIVSITKGTNGVPGEITGMIHYINSNIVGSISKNDGSGIYGKYDGCAEGSEFDGLISAPLPIGYKGEVHLGEAEIISNVDGSLRRYEIEITSMNPTSADHRGLNIKVIDKDLLDLTGGIIQGMSGSPIIQDGKIIGAVTHVLVSDPTKGYGIYIEDMLDNMS